MKSEAIAEVLKQQMRNRSEGAKDAMRYIARRSESNCGADAVELVRSRGLGALVALESCAESFRVAGVDEGCIDDAVALANDLHGEVLWFDPAALPVAEVAEVQG